MKSYLWYNFQAWFMFGQDKTGVISELRLREHTSRQFTISWWRHQMEAFSASLVLCNGNPPMTGGFPSERPVTQSFDVFFDLRLNKRLSKHSRRWWFEAPSTSLLCHCNVSREPGPTGDSPNERFRWIQVIFSLNIYALVTQRSFGVSPRYLHINICGIHHQRL